VSEIIIGQDARVARWMFEVSNSRPMLYNMAVGLADESGALVGGIMFTGFNGSEIECHFYGPGTLNRRILRLIMGLAVKQFNVNRMTVRTRKKSMARGVTKLGAVFEGTIRRLYGPSDERHHSGRQYAFFRETMEKLAGLSHGMVQENSRRDFRLSSVRSGDRKTILEEANRDENYCW